ncbi:hypothetical protein FPV67DRAFT_35489 [Lyophyllum atratum]|nr:hypothetical protein FPV67DRAFT_35489 [Lyophyllum atratum]
MIVIGGSDSHDVITNKPPNTLRETSRVPARARHNIMFESKAKSTNAASNGPEDAKSILKAFIAHDPQAKYTFDSERNSPQSEICRKGAPEEADCITLQMNSKRLFEAMQNLGFFCALPINPERTYIECRPMPK